MDFCSQIYEKFLDNKMGHAFLIETNNMAFSYLRIVNLVKKINCPKEFKSNCEEECNICYLLENNKTLNFITIEPDGFFIKKEQIQNLKTKFSKSAMELKYNVYVIKNPERMNAVAANTLLKFLEEPDSNTICFLLTGRKDNVLSTLVSRCQIYKDLDIDFQQKTKYEEIISTIISNIELKNKIFSIKIDKSIKELFKEKEEILELFKGLYQNYNLALKSIINSKNADNQILDLIINNNSEYMLIEKLKIIKKTIDNLMLNVNIELVFNSFIIKMIREGEKNDSM